MFRFVFLLTLPLLVFTYRDKLTDEEYNTLIPLADIPIGCSSPKDDYAIVDGKLEKCSRFVETGENEQLAYEKFKCKHLRVHGKLNENGKCQCDSKYQGPVCNDFVGCPNDMTLFNRVCAPHCRHNGTLAFSSRNVECICKAPFDGRFCDRLACWRMAPKEHERRYRNAGDHCECAKGLKGENCDEVVSCENGELISGRCKCVEGYKGETCAIKCSPGLTCGSGSLSSGITLSLFVSARPDHRFLVSVVRWTTYMLGLFFVSHSKTRSILSRTCCQS
ncbi:hypothetical protein M3Y94_00261400 [Aphelenchoides besseyi]|nr:hypothetical protein M3Y94_00261400 [Aphelenchoides besseyi]